jgi:branched-chain amino acid transport system ATP-binding protein
VLDVLRERLRELRGTGQALLIAEQNVDLALDVADRLAVIGESGRIEWEGDPAELRNDPVLMNDLVGL